MSKWFIEECKQWYKQWSAWLSALWATLVTMFWLNPGIFKELVDQLPEDTRAKLSPLVLFSVAALPILVRNLKQTNRTSSPNGSDGS